MIRLRDLDLTQLTNSRLNDPRVLVGAAVLVVGTATVLSSILTGMLLTALGLLFSLWAVQLLTGIFIFIIVTRLLRTSIFVTGLVLTGWAHLFLGDIDVGPFSLRIYLAIALGGLLLTSVATHHRPLFQSVLARRITILYVAFILWYVLNLINYGSDAQAIIRYFFSQHIFAMVLFVVTQATITEERNARILVFGLVAAAVLTGLVGILQWLDIQWAWDISRSLRVHADSIITWERGALTAPPGLALFSIPQSYYVLVFGMLGVSWAALKPRTGLRLTGVALIIALVILGALITTASRSAVAGAGISIIVMVLAAGTFPRLAKTYVRQIALLNVVLLVITAVLINSSVLDETFARINIDQLTHLGNFQDNQRQALLTGTLSFIPNALFWGGANEFEEFFDAHADPSVPRGDSPHNLFLNAIVFTGLPGLLLMVGLLALLWRSVRLGWAASRQAGALRWLNIGLVASLVAYLVHSQFHNANFVAGDAIPWFTIGLLVNIPLLSLSSTKDQTPAKSTTPHA